MAGFIIRKPNGGKGQDTNHRRAEQGKLGSGDR